MALQNVSEGCMNTDWLVALFDGEELLSVKFGLLTVTLQLEEVTLPFTMQ